MLHWLGADDKGVEPVVARIYRPILAAYFGLTALYLTAISLTHFWYFDGIDLFRMTFVAAATIIVGAAGWYRVTHRQSTTGYALELLVMNALVVCNVVVALDLQFRTEKLVYFVVLAMMFSMASARFAQSLVSLAMVAAAFLHFLSKADPDGFVMFAFIASAAAMASLTISYVLRSAILRIARAKQDAEQSMRQAKKGEGRMRRKAFTDSLTGLPNRSAFFAHLREIHTELSTSPPQDSRDSGCIESWLVLVDLDGFKTINEIHGHQFGDSLLVAVAKRLEEHAPVGTLVSRMGGDEFNLLLKLKPQDAQSIEVFCTNLVKELARPYEVESRCVRVSASVGCKRVVDSASERHQIMQADFALRVAKRQGRNRFVLFGEEHERDCQERSQLEQALREADLDKEFSLLFQPQINLITGELTSAEVLARWTSPTVGNVRPDRFIRIAEECGLIGDITLTVVRKALSEMASLPRHLPVSINLSSHDLMSPTTIGRIIELTQEAGVAPHLIEFEITETAMLEDIAMAAANLGQLAAQGFTIALDDFGTGYSNFNYLRSLPISKLKVDQSFLQNPGDPMSEKILRSLAGIAKTLGVHCLLEGVENEIDLLVAKRVGAGSVQGYHLGKPMSSSALCEKFEQYGARPDSDPEKPGTHCQ